MVIRFLSPLFGLLVMLAAPTAHAREGDYMGNGGGLGEQNAVFVWTQFEQMTSMLILERPESAKALRAVLAARASFQTASMEVRPLAELTTSQLASSRHYEGFIAVGDEPQPKFVWVRERLQDDHGSALSLERAAYWATRALSARARLDQGVSEQVSRELARAFATELQVKALTRYNRLEVRLLTLKGQVVYLESPKNIASLPLPMRLCESQELKSSEESQMVLGESAWMNDESWDVPTSTLYLGARANLQVSCTNEFDKIVILEGEVTWEIPFSVRDRTGAKIPYARAKDLLMKSDYALVAGKVSWFGVRDLRRRE
jgi:hypothetical protein